MARGAGVIFGLAGEFAGSAFPLPATFPLEVESCQEGRFFQCLGKGNESKAETIVQDQSF